MLRIAQVGIEYNPEVNEVVPLATIFLVTETERRPALFVGTSSDRVGSPEGTQSFYLTASKLVPKIPVSVYGSVNYSQWSDGVNYPFGGEWYVWGGFSVRGMYDGEETHALVSWFGDRFGVSLMAVWLDTFGISVAGGF